VGADLAGGNFWKGALTGLIVTGLNDLMHTGYLKYTLSKAIRKTGRNPNARADIESSQLNDFAKEILPTSMDKCDNPVFKLVDKLQGKNHASTGAQNYGETPAYTNDGGKTYKPSGIINISRLALESWLVLASTMGHELNHYFHFSSGAYDRWTRKFGAEYAEARSEYIAQNWEYRVGGIPTMSIMSDNYNLMMSYHYAIRNK
jgi:hypothetical protein